MGETDCGRKLLWKKLGLVPPDIYPVGNTTTLPIPRARVIQCHFLPLFFFSLTDLTPEVSFICLSSLLATILIFRLIMSHLHFAQTFNWSLCLQLFLF